jgi:hypothetical protein
MVLQEIVKVVLLKSSGMPLCSKVPLFWNNDDATIPQYSEHSLLYRSGVVWRLTFVNSPQQYLGTIYFFNAGFSKRKCCAGCLDFRHFVLGAVYILLTKRIFHFFCVGSKWKNGKKLLCLLSAHSPSIKCRKFKLPAWRFLLLTGFNKRNRYAGCLNLLHFILEECTYTQCHSN